jgi:hypothetical protein
MGSFFSREKYRIDLLFPLREQFREYIDEDYLENYLHAEEKTHKYTWTIMDGEVPALLKKPYEQKLYMLSIDELLEYYQGCSLRSHEYEIINNDDGKRVLIIYYSMKKESYIISKPLRWFPVQIVMKD